MLSSGAIYLFNCSACFYFMYQGSFNELLPFDVSPQKGLKIILGQSKKY